MPGSTPGPHPFLLLPDPGGGGRASRAGEGYPPCDIEQLGPHRFRITLAVAGFAEDELSVTATGRQLVICGRQAAGPEGRIFLYRGIAARAFRRSFQLAGRVEVRGARLENGLLHVDLESEQPRQVVQTIPISRR